MPTRRVLLVSYNFPPRGGSGVQRALKLAKYLPRSGWRAEVLTAGHRHYPLSDARLAEEIGGQMGLHRVMGWEPGGIAARLCRHLPASLQRACDARPTIEDRVYWRLERWAARLSLPEVELAWVPTAIGAARRLVAEGLIDAVVTTSPPHCTHLVGRSLKRRLRLPWIADLRDPLLDNFAHEDAPPRARRFLRWIETMVMSEADRVVVTCPELAEALADRHGGAVLRRIIVIPNGYDPADRPHETLRTHYSNRVAQSGTASRFVLAHVGAFYRQQSVEPLLDAMRRLLADRPELFGRIELRIVGSISARQKSLIRATDERFLNVVGYRSHEEAIREMAAADALLLLTPLTPGGRLCIPAKTYEYLAFGGHVLASVHEETALARLLREAGGCTLIGDGGVRSWRDAIARCLAMWEHGSLPARHRQDVVQRFRRDALADRFASVLDGCLGEGPRLLITDDLFASRGAA